MLFKQNKKGKTRKAKSQHVRRYQISASGRDFSYL